MPFNVMKRAFRRRRFEVSRPGAPVTATRCRCCSGVVRCCQVLFKCYSSVVRVPAPVAGRRRAFKDPKGERETRMCEAERSSRHVGVHQKSPADREDLLNRKREGLRLRFPRFPRFRTPPAACEEPGPRLVGSRPGSRPTADTNASRNSRGAPVKPSLRQSLKPTAQTSTQKLTFTFTLIA